MKGGKVGVPYKRFVKAFTGCAVLLVAVAIVPARCVAASSGIQIFNVVDFGAKTDASTPATNAFKAAIQAAKTAGGGTIYVPPGNYSSGPIELFSHMTLDVDAGATIVFPVAPLSFVKGRYLGVEALVPKPLVGGHDVENVTITGRGTLKTGDFYAWAKAYGLPAPDKSGSEYGPHWDHVLNLIEEKQPVSDEEYRAAAPELRPSFVNFTNSKNILIEDVHIIGGPIFVVHLLYSQYATVRNVMIEAYPGMSANGIVVDSSRFVRISDDYVDAGDDGIVVKAGKDADGLRVNRPSRDVTITNCTVYHAHGAVVIGSETSGSISNVVASNITAIDTENGIRIKSRRGRGGVVEDVRFDNFTMENVGTGIEVTSYYVKRAEGPTTAEPVSERTPIFRNIAISNVTIKHATTSAIDIEGLPEMPIAGLRLTDIIASGNAGLAATHIDGLELHHVQVNPEQGPAFAIQNASNLFLDDVTSRKPAPGSPVIWLNECPGAILRSSRAYPETGVFLSVKKGELRTVTLESNTLSNAATQTEESDSAGNAH
jgi:polygalacturonase